MEAGAVITPQIAEKLAKLKSKKIKVVPFVSNEIIYHAGG